MNISQRITELKDKIEKTFSSLTTVEDMQYYFEEFNREVDPLIGTLTIENLYPYSNISCSSTYNQRAVHKLKHLLIDKRRGFFEKMEAKEV